LPIEVESVDVVISNGVLNLVPEKRAAVAEIRRGLKPGGRVRPTAEAIAAHAGVDEVRAELLPEDKVAVVADLVERHGMTAMVGA
jgi:high-affinity K+ transport system ATPase subunit B